MRKMLIASALCIAAGTAAGEPRWYVGGGEAQRIYERMRVECYEDSRRLWKLEDNTFNFGSYFTVCLQAEFTEVDRREGASYGVIVYGYRGDHDAYGVAWNYRWAEEAHSAAYQNCREQGGNQCILRHMVRNGCIAYARGYDQHGFGSGRTLRDAESVALDHCADNMSCRIRISKCSTHRYYEF